MLKIVHFVKKKKKKKQEKKSNTKKDNTKKFCSCWCIYCFFFFPLWLVCNMGITTLKWIRWIHLQTQEQSKGFFSLYTPNKKSITVCGWWCSWSVVIPTNYDPNQKACRDTHGFRCLCFHTIPLPWCSLCPCKSYLQNIL